MNGGNSQEAPNGPNLGNMFKGGGQDSMRMQELNTQIDKNLAAQNMEKVKE